jgi:hypothetical protein
MSKAEMDGATQGKDEESAPAHVSYGSLLITLPGLATSSSTVYRKDVLTLAVRVSWKPLAETGVARAHGLSASFSNGRRGGHTPRWSCFLL